MNCERHDFDVLPGCGACILRLLQNLLAVIHGDGGHHTEWVGIPLSVEHATARIYDLRKQLDLLKYTQDK